MNTARYRTEPSMSLSDEQLSAFADGQLSRRQAHHVARTLRRNPAYADRIHGYWRHEAALYQALQSADLPTGSLPDATGRRKWAWLAGSSAAASLLLAAGLWAVWPRHSPSPVNQPDYISAALDAYHSAPPLSHSNPGVNQDVSLPFMNLGLKAAGNQVLQVANQPLREFRYIGPEDQRLALYKVPDANQRQHDWLRLFAGGRFPLVEWYSNSNRYLLVGSGSAKNLTQLAIDMQNRLNQPASPGQGAHPVSQPQGPRNSSAENPQQPMGAQSKATTLDM